MAPADRSEGISRALPSLPAAERRSHARDASPRLPRGSARARSSLAAIVNCFSTGARSRRISLASPRSHRAGGTINGRNAREAAEQAAQRTVNSRSLTNHRRRRSPCHTTENNIKLFAKLFALAQRVCFFCKEFESDLQRTRKYIFLAQKMKV